MHINYIEKRRKQVIDDAAEKLFESITKCAVNSPPSNGDYMFDARVPVTFDADELNEMMLKATTDRFVELGLSATLCCFNANDATVSVKLSPASNTTVKLVGKFYWSRHPGRFVNKLTGEAVNLSLPNTQGPSFTGTVREWYETLIETLIDACNSIHREIAEPATSVYVGADILTILECSILYRPTFSTDDAPPPPYVGELSRRFKVYKDESLARNQAIVSHTKDGVKYVFEVEVTDMNII